MEDLLFWRQFFGSWTISPLFLRVSSGLWKTSSFWFFFFFFNNYRIFLASRQVSIWYRKQSQLTQKFFHPLQLTINNWSGPSADNWSSKNQAYVISEKLFSKRKLLITLVDKDSQPTYKNSKKIPITIYCQAHSSTIKPSPVKTSVQ